MRLLTQILTLGLLASHATYSRSQELPDEPLQSPSQEAAAFQDATAEPVTDPTQRACQELLLANDVTAESVCSDAIARISVATTLSLKEQIALASVYNNRAIVRTRAGNLEGAELDFQNALSLAPETWSIYLNRGNLRLAQGLHQDALADYALVMELAGRPVMAAYRNSTLAFRGSSDIASAEAAWASAEHHAFSREQARTESEDRPGLPAAQPR
jgi:tetratricopeptide (TPR) repeat protein